MSLIIFLFITAASVSIAASVITTRVMAERCFKLIDDYFTEALESIKKVSLDALEEMKDR